MNLILDSLLLVSKGFKSRIENGTLKVFVGDLFGKLPKP